MLDGCSQSGRGGRPGVQDHFRTQGTARPAHWFGGQKIQVAEPTLMGRVEDA